MAIKIDIRPAWVAEKPFVTSLLQSKKNQVSVKFSTESCVEISMTIITIVGQVDFGPEAIAKMFMKSVFLHVHVLVGEIWKGTLLSCTRSVCPIEF